MDTLDIEGALNIGGQRMYIFEVSLSNQWKDKGAYKTSVKKAHIVGSGGRSI